MVGRFPAGIPASTLKLWGLAAWGCCAVLMLLSPFYLAALLGILGICFYNGREGEGNQAMTDLCYPVMLLIMGILGRLL